MKQELEVIMGLMEDLKEKMQFGEEDFSERLGRKKPEVEVMKLDVESAPDGEMAEEEILDGDMMEEESPEDKLKKRLMKLRS